MKNNDDWKEKYKKLPLWSQDELINILLGYEPDFKGYKDIDKNNGYFDEKNDAEEIIQRAIEVKELEFVIDFVKPKGRISSEEERQEILYGYGRKFDPILFTKWVEKRQIFQDFPFNSKEIENIMLSTNASLLVSKLDESQYWNKLKSKLEKAIEEYPAWRSRNPGRNKSSGFHQWLLGKDINADTQEVNVVSRVLTDIFDDL